jgi:acetate---CoA ligase (ADP-forming)
LRDTLLRDTLRPLFQPAHVAVIGASSTPDKHGNIAVRYLIRAGYRGRISPVNPNGGEIEGLACHRSIKDVPRPVDCAFLVVPAGAAIDAIRACAEAGVRSAIIGANGFAELGTDEGRARQAELTAIVRTSGMRIVGPNTNGILNATDRLSLGYNTSHGDPLYPGPVSIAAHSGALFNAIAPRLRRFGVGLSKFVPVGNEADLDMLDFLEFFIADEATGVIGLIIEGLSDGDRLRALAADARAAGKPIVALKLGRSAAGAGATVAHSSRLAGSARAYAALLRECRITTVPTIEAMAGGCALLAGRGPHPGDPSLVCVTSTGGGGSLLADYAMDYGIPLAGTANGTWSGGAAAAIASFAGAGPICNPIDGRKSRQLEAARYAPRGDRSRRTTRTIACLPAHVAAGRRRPHHHQLARAAEGADGEPQRGGCARRAAQRNRGAIFPRRDSALSRPRHLLRQPALPL